MTTVAAHFYGGPFDGEIAHWPATETLDWRLEITPDRDPSVLSVYWLHSIDLASDRRVRYVYEATVPKKMA